MKKWMYLALALMLAGCRKKGVWHISADKHTATTGMGRLEPGQWTGHPPPKCHHILEFVFKGKHLLRVFGSSTEMISYETGLLEGGYPVGFIANCSRENKHEDEVQPCGPKEEWNSCEE